MTSLKHLFTVERCQASALLNVHVSLYFSLDGQMHMLQVTSYTGQNPKLPTKKVKQIILSFSLTAWEQGGARGCQGAPLPPKNFACPLKIFHVTSCHCIEVLHRPLRAPLVAKLAPPNENVWLRPCLGAFTFLFVI